MIASWIAKRQVQTAWERLGQDDYDVDAMVAGFSEDAIWDSASDFSVGETLRGKKAIREWLEMWKKEFPKRRAVVKNVCMKGTCLPSPNNVVMVEWTCWETDKQGKEFQYDGVSVIHLKNMKVVHESEYVSFKGLPKLSTLMKPTAKA